MSDSVAGNYENLVATGRRDLASVGAANPLVSRGIADLAKSKPPSEDGNAHSNRKDAEICYDRGDAWWFKEDYDNAIQEFDEAIRLDSKYVAAILMRGHCWRRKREYVKAFSDFDMAVRLKVMWDERANSYEEEGVDSIYSDLSQLFAESSEEGMRDGKRAILFATKVCEQTDWQHSGALEILAAAYAEAGQFDEAVRFQTEAMEMSKDTAHWDKVGLEKDCRRLALFRQGKPVPTRQT